MAKTGEVLLNKEADGRRRSRGEGEALRAFFRWGRGFHGCHGESGHGVGIYTEGITLSSLLPQIAGRIGNGDGYYTPG